ncbi:MAG TPA: anion permease [Polyangia bacterium]|nr:anion permease [Polyangia bacterium]
MTWIVLGIVLLLAWSNGSNDNFKGVATLYGSGTTSYRGALAWATVTTLAGSLLTLALASALVKTFSAKGLVPDALAESPAFLGAVALAAAATVLAASVLGMPVSTTHALTGSLVGAGLASGQVVRFGTLGKSFFLPLLVSPVLAAILAMLLYPLARRARRALKAEPETCVCLTEEVTSVAAPGGVLAAERVQLAVVAGKNCPPSSPARVMGVSAARALDTAHFLSAGALSFARGLNDTPKIVALLVGGRALGADAGLLAVGLAMAVGGLLGARRVAETLSRKIVHLNAGQGFVANLIAAVLVIGASRVGLPVSTTHVSTGGLFGIGMVTGTARWKTITTILLAWVTTLPLAAIFGAAAMRALG